MKKRFYQTLWSQISDQLFFPMILVLLCVYLSFINYIPNTFLSGWDTLHPEFDFPLAFQRVFWGVFRIDQGLGAVAAHSHMADLPRILILAFSSLLIPIDLLRYSFISLNLLVGVLGVYFFIKRFLIQDKNKFFSSAISFTGGLFYLFNLGTLQQFYVPFEMFTVQFAMLPWIFFTTINFIRNTTKKNLAIFCLVIFLSTPMAYAATLWYAFFLGFILFLLFFIRGNFKKILILLTCIIAINSFWLLPNLYFITSKNAAFVPEAKINKIFSEEAFYYNKSYGQLADALVFKNFLFDWTVYKGEGKFDYLLQNWRIHFQNELVSSIGYILTAFVLLGVVYSLKSRNAVSKALIIPLVIALVFIINLNPPFEFAFSFLRDNVPLFKEALRFPYTKFSIVLMFCFSCFFGLGQSYFFNILKKFTLNLKINLHILVLTQTFIIAVLFVIFMKPYFSGDLISKYMQVNIPVEYFEMFVWFNTQPSDKRVAVFPVHSFWGWIYYKWGFQGAQFITFGIKQPVLDRDYDRWNKNNENYFREISHAVYSQNYDLLTKVLEKYGVSYLVIDENVIEPGPDQEQSILYFNQLKSLFDNNNKRIKLVKRFNKIGVYEFKGSENAISSPSKFSVTSGPDGPKDIDWQYFQNGNYISLDQQSKKYGKLNTYYPFASIINNQNILNNKMINLEDGIIEIATDNLPSKLNLFADDYLDDESVLPADLYIQKTNDKLLFKIYLNNIVTNSSDQSVLTYSIPIETKQTQNQEWIISLNNTQTLKLNILTVDNYIYQGKLFLNTKLFNNLQIYQKDNDKYKTSKLKKEDFIKIPMFLCGYTYSNQLTGASINENKITLRAKNAQGCFYLPLNKTLERNQVVDAGDLLNLRFKILSNSNIKGHYCIFDNLSQRCVKERKNIDNNEIVDEYFNFNNHFTSGLDLILYIDALGLDEEILEYSGFNYAILSPIKTLSIPPFDIKNILSNKKIALDKDTSLKIAYSNSSIDVDLLDTNNLSEKCNAVTAGFTDRKIDRKEKVVKYASEKGSVCDYFSLPNLPHNVGYLVEFETKNDSGLPPRICVGNPYSKRCDLYTSLESSPNFSRQALVIPPINDGGYGYDIHINNYAVGKVRTVNEIRSLKVIPFPYNWITKMKLVNSQDKTEENGVKIATTKQYWPGFYKVDLKNSSDGLVVLNVSYEEGWWASGGEHVKVNGWANGWIIDTDSKSGSVVIFYLPQLLQFLGFLILLMMLIYFVSPVFTTILRVFPSIFSKKTSKAILSG